MYRGYYLTIKCILYIVKNQKTEAIFLNKPIRVRDVMTDSELKAFEELNDAVLKSATSMERRFYNKKINELIEDVKDRYFNEKKVVNS